MGNLLDHPTLIGGQEGFTSTSGQRYRAGGADKVVRSNHFGVDRGEDDRIGNEGSELLHQIERQGGPAGARMVVDGRVRASGLRRLHSVELIRQTDPDPRAARTLGAGNQRRRGRRGLSKTLRLGHGGLDLAG